MAFKKAAKQQSHLRLAIQGPAGSGKSYTSLVLARTLGSPIAAFDTEHKSLSKYAGDVADFDVPDIVAEDYHPRHYIDFLSQAAAAHYPIVVIDSLSHAWNGRGGVLETVDKLGGNKFSNGWRQVTPVQSQLTESMLAYPGHVIATMRSKMDYVVEQVTDARTGQTKAVPKKIGLAPVQRDGIQYEFDVIIDASLEGILTVTKTRCSALANGVFRYDETSKIAETLKTWLNSGVALSERDTLMEEMSFASTREALQLLVPRIAALGEEDKQALRITYARRVEELAAL